MKCDNALFLEYLQSFNNTQLLYVISTLFINFNFWYNSEIFEWNVFVFLFLFFSKTPATQGKAKKMMDKYFHTVI